MKNVNINFYFENNDNIIKNYVKAKVIDNTLYFDINDDKIEIDLKKNIFKKENNESILKLLFNEKKEEKGTYYIKELNGNFEIYIETLNLKNNENKFFVNYRLKIENEILGDFNLKVEIMEE